MLREVPLNKDIHTQRGREREATAAAVELLVHSTHTKSICAEVDDAECVCGGENHRMHYFTSRYTAVPFMTDSYTRVVQIYVLCVLRGPRISSLTLACFPQSSAPVAFWVVSASLKLNTTRCSCPHHKLGEVTTPPRRGTIGVGDASRICEYGVAMQSVYVLLLYCRALASGV